MSHSLTFKRSWLSLDSISSTVEALMERVVSSANNLALVVWRHLGRSLIYNRNKNGPRLDPLWNSKDSFEELKKFVEEVLPTIDGEWGCPGGDVKQYKSVVLDLRWHPSTRSITLNGKLKENINEKLIHLALVTEQLNNKDIEHAATDKCRMNEPEGYYLAESKTSRNGSRCTESG